MGEGDTSHDKEAGGSHTSYTYDSPHDTSEYTRSLEKFFYLQDEDGTPNPPSLILAMTIGVDGLDHVLKSPPFSTLKSKSLQENYIPINDVLKKEVLRRSHFLLKELDSKKDHPLRDNSQRLRMPQPAQWTREKRVKFLEDKNMLELHPLDIAFLKAKVEDIKAEVIQMLGEQQQAKQSCPERQRGRPPQSSSEPVESSEATGGKKRGSEDGPAMGDATATARSRSKGRRQSKGRHRHDGDDETRPSALCDSVAKCLYGAANGSTVLFGLSEDEATVTLEYLLNNWNEASRFLKVGQDFYNTSMLSPEETLERSVQDLVKFCQRKRIKTEAMSPAPVERSISTSVKETSV